MAMRFKLSGWVRPRLAVWCALAAPWLTCSSPAEATEAAADGARILALLRGLGSESFEERLQAELALAQMGAKVLPALETASRGGDAEVEMRARRLMVQIQLEGSLGERMKASFPGLAQRLASAPPEDWLEFMHAALEKPEIPVGEWSALIARALEGAHELDQYELGAMNQTAGDLYGFDLLLERAENEPGAFREPAVWTGILRLLEHREPKLRARAVYVLSHLGTKEAIPQLIKLLQDDHEDLRWQAALALGGLGAKEGIPHLLECLKAGRPSIRSEAASALGGLGAQDAIPHLIEALGDNQKVESHFAVAVGDSAELALGALENNYGRKPEFTPRIIELLGHDRADVRSRAASVLGNWGIAESTPQLLKALKDDAAKVRA